MYNYYLKILFKGDQGFHKYVELVNIPLILFLNRQKWTLDVTHRTVNGHFSIYWAPKHDQTRGEAYFPCYL